MSTPNVEPHVAAVMTRLREQLNPTGEGLNGSLGVAPPGIPGYAVYPDPGDVQQARLAGDRSMVVIRFAVTAVGEGPEQVLWVADHVRQVMLGDPPEVMGRVIRRLSQSGSGPVIRDDSIDPPLWFSSADYRLMSQAA